MGINSLQELLVHEMQDILSAEQQVMKALPKMAEKATNPQLKQGFKMHLKQTEGQIARLERAFEALGEEAESEHCKGMEGLIAEGEKVMKEVGDPDALDAALIGAAQKVEHYEICSYGTVRTWARQLGLHEIEQLLQQTLDEEEATDKKLTSLAEAGINQQAR